MSSPYSYYPGPSYANVAAAGTFARAGRTVTPSSRRTSTAVALPYSHIPYPPTHSERPHMSRQERRYSARAELEASESAGSAPWRRGSNAGHMTRHEDTSGHSYHADALPFFTPSYLTRSRHVLRLKQAWEEHVQAQQGQAEADNASRLLVSSTTSSTTNLVRVRSSSPAVLMHRGVSHQIIERPPVHLLDSDSNLRRLPTQWHEHHKAAGLEILGDGTEVRFAGVQLKTHDDAASIRTDSPIPKEIGLYYYEVTVMSRGKDALVGVGLATSKTNLSRLPGWEPESFAYHGDDGAVFSGTPTGRAYGPHFSGYDIIGCGINFRTNSIFFTKNGVFLGTAFSDIKPAIALYPCVGLRKSGDHLRVNFGRHPFVFDIDAMMEQERRTVLGTITKQAVDKLHPPDDEPTLIQNLIGQYLAHEGYVEASRAFQQDLRDWKRLAPSTAGHPLAQEDANDDVHAINRQRIRRAMLDGDVDRALKYTKTCFPSVLRDPRNKAIYFRLRCRKFIEMMRQWSQISTVHSKAAASGHLTDDTHQPDTQMELDDQLQREAIKDVEEDDDDMDVAADLQHPSTSKEKDMFEAAIEYGKGLQAEFESDAAPSVKKDLSDIFALMCYPDPRTSSLGYLLDKSGRSSIAEELNGAILVSLGKPPSAALEKLCSQTESFLDDVAQKTGGAAAFINVRQDFL